MVAGGNEARRGGFTITMVNSSARTRGLRNIANRYGYQWFDNQIMLMVIVLLVILVEVIQRTATCARSATV